MRRVGKYQLIRKLATGGMAEVFLAKAPGPRGSEKTLVLKCILPRLAEEPSFVEMFLSEAKLAARLTHSHIVQIFDYGEADGAYFIAMEYIDGPSVGALIQKAQEHGQALSPALCARLVAEACEGLSFAHDFTNPETRQPLNLIHRDVSPDNLLLSRQGKLKVVDFGIAKATGQEHQTQAGIIRGKLAYMAPEQLRGQPLDRRADVYALGVVLYELLTGQRPYGARLMSQNDLMRALLEDAPVPAAVIRPDLPEPLPRILDQTLARDPDLRYQDCASLQADLEEFILESGRPVTHQHVAQLIAQFEPPVRLKSPPLDATGPDGPAHPMPELMTRSMPEFTQPALSPPRAAIPTAPVLKAPVRPPVDEDATEEMTLSPPADELPALEPLSAEFPARGHPVTPPGRRHPALIPDTQVYTAVPPRSRKSTPKLRPWMLAALAVGALAAVEGVLWLAADTSGNGLPVSDTSLAPSPADKMPADTLPVPEPKHPGPERPEPQLQPQPPAFEEPEPRAESQETAGATRESRGTSPLRNVARGSLTFRVTPGTSVFVDGKLLGSTPLAPTNLVPGRHMVRLVNAQLARTVVRHIEVQPEESTVLQVDLARQ